jgi:hypothetical protein
LRVLLRRSQKRQAARLCTGQKQLLLLLLLLSLLLLLLLLLLAQHVRVVRACLMQRLLRKLLLLSLLLSLLLLLLLLLLPLLQLMMLIVVASHSRGRDVDSHRAAGVQLGPRRARCQCRGGCLRGLLLLAEGTVHLIQISQHCGRPLPRSFRHGDRFATAGREPQDGPAGGSRRRAPHVEWIMVVAAACTLRRGRAASAASAFGHEGRLEAAAAATERARTPARKVHAAPAGEPGWAGSDDAGCFEGLGKPAASCAATTSRPRA